MTDGTTTSVAGASPQNTAPVRLDGQTNSEVLFNWLVINRYLWMFDTAHDPELERIFDPRARLKLGYKLHQGHPALVAPEDEETRRAAFARLERLIKFHVFGPSTGPNAGERGSQ